MEIETGWLRSGPRILIMISSSSAALRGLNGWLIIRASTMTVVKIIMTIMISNKAICSSRISQSIPNTLGQLIPFHFFLSLVSMIPLSMLMIRCPDMARSTNDAGTGIPVAANNYHIIRCLVYFYFFIYLFFTRLALMPCIKPMKKTPQGHPRGLREPNLSSCMRWANWRWSRGRAQALSFHMMLLFIYFSANCFSFPW